MRSLPPPSPPPITSAPVNLSRYPAELPPPLVGLEMEPGLFRLLDGQSQLIFILAHARIAQEGHDIASHVWLRGLTYIERTACACHSEGDT